MLSTLKTFPGWLRAQRRCPKHRLRWARANPNPLDFGLLYSTLNEGTGQPTHGVLPEGKMTQLRCWRGKDSAQKGCLRISTPAPSVPIGE
jgi:hypothetical protein